MATTPNFTKTPRTELAILSAANTNRDGTGAIVKLFAASNAGSLVERITFSALDTTTNGMIRFYISGSAGINLYLESIVTAVTPSSTVPSYRQSLGGISLLLASGTSLYGSTNNNESFSIVVEGGDFE